MSHDEDNPGWPREPDVCPYCMESPCRCRRPSEPDDCCAHDGQWCCEHLGYCDRKGAAAPTALDKLCGRHEHDARSVDEKKDLAAEWRDKWADQDGNYPEDEDIDF